MRLIWSYLRSLFLKRGHETGMRRTKRFIPMFFV